MKAKPTVFNASVFLLDITLLVRYRIDLLKESEKKSIIFLIFLNLDYNEIIQKIISYDTVSQDKGKLYKLSQLNVTKCISNKLKFPAPS